MAGSGYGVGTASAPSPLEQQPADEDSSILSARPEGNWGLKQTGCLRAKAWNDGRVTAGPEPTCGGAPAPGSLTASQRGGGAVGSRSPPDC